MGQMVAAVRQLQQPRRTQRVEKHQKPHPHHRIAVLRRTRQRLPPRHALYAAFGRRAGTPSGRSRSGTRGGAEAAAGKPSARQQNGAADLAQRRSRHFGASLSGRQRHYRPGRVGRHPPKRVSGRTQPANPHLPRRHAVQPAIHFAGRRQALSERRPQIGRLYRSRQRGRYRAGHCGCRRLRHRCQHPSGYRQTRGRRL